MHHLGTVIELAVRAEVSGETLVPRVAPEQLDERIRPVDFAPADTAGAVGGIVHGTQGAASDCIQRGAGDAPEGFLGSARVDEVVVQILVQVGGRIGPQHLVAQVQALLVLLHVQVHAGEQGAGGIVGDVAGVAAAGGSLQEGDRFFKVGLDLVIHLTHGGPFRHGAIRGGAEHHARIVAAQGILFGVQAAQAQVAERPHEVVLAQQLVVQGFPFGHHLNDGVGRVDDLVAAPPEIVGMLQIRGIVITGRVVDRRRRGAGKHGVVSAHLGHMVPHLDECETIIGLAPVFHRRLEHRVVAVRGEHGGTRVVLELGGSHGIAAIEIHVAPSKRQDAGQKQEYVKSSCHVP